MKLIVPDNTAPCAIIAGYDCHWRGRTSVCDAFEDDDGDDDG